MSTQQYVRLPDRGLIRLSGTDAVEFLQGLVSNDIARVSADHAVYAAFLTPQGKFLHDFFVARIGDDLIIDCEGPRRDDLKRRLTMFRLRAQVDIDDVTDAFDVAALIGSGIAETAGLADAAGTAGERDGGCLFVDPRLADAGLRAIMAPATLERVVASLGLIEATGDEYDTLRLSLGLPDGSRDMIVEKAILLESGFEELHGVDWDKGCYVGQELTARTKYRGLIRKRLMPVTISGLAPAPGTPIMAGDKEAGEMRSANGGIGLALLRLERIEGETILRAGQTELTPIKPAWVNF